MIDIFNTENGLREDSAKAPQKEKTLSIVLFVFLSYVLLHIIFGRHQLPAYDAYTYIGFAEHYAKNWFTTLIPSQAHGLQIASYPPLLFQVMALLSFIPLLELNHIYIILASLGSSSISISLYYLLDTFFGHQKKISHWVIPFIAFSPGLIKSTLLYGQMTFLFGMTFGFTASALFYKTIKGQKNTGAFIIVLLALTSFIHHFSLVITGLILIIISLTNLRDTINSLDYLASIAIISATIIFLSLSTMIKEILFGFSQGTIPHNSRTPLESTRIFNQYITSTYGVSIAGIWLIIKNKFSPLSVKLITSIFLILGLGLVTAAPKILFGSFANILVYTRFSIVAALLLSGLIGVYITEKTPTKLVLSKISVKHILMSIFMLLGILNMLWANSIHLGGYTGYDTHNPNQTATAIQFLNEEASSDYLYVTHRHMQPVDEIRMNTEIPTLDTGYYPGRKIEEFKSFGKLDRLPPDKFKKVVDNADKLSLKYILSFSKETHNLMNSSEWNRKSLNNSVDVWVNKDAPKYTRETAEENYLFGTLPILILLSSALIFRSRKTRNKLESLIELVQSKIQSSAAKFNNKKSSAVTIFLLVLIAVLPSLITQGLPAGIDTPSYLFRIETISSMLEEHGKIFNWSNMWYNGYPFSSLYSPLSHHLVHLVKTATGDLTLSYNLVRLSALTLLSGAVYKLSRNISGDQRVSTIATGLIIFSYPIYSNLYTAGRFSSAIALPVYLLLIDILHKEDVFTKEVTKSNIYLGLGAALLFLTHSMMAYLFIFTGILFAFVYWQRVKKAGLLPLLVTSTIPAILSISYISKLVQHMTIIDSSWYIKTISFTIQEQLKLSFNTLTPVYIGIIYTSLLIYGLANYFKSENKFLRFSILNFGLFYLFYWSRNFKVASLLIPLSKNFDRAEFEILFTTFGVFIAAYGFKYLLEEHLSKINHLNKNIFTIVLIIAITISMSPMIIQSSNWSPKFLGEIQEAPIEDDYRAIGVGMRTWHSYLLYRNDVPNTFGWFDQSNPNKEFTKALQATGGRWYGGKVNFNKYNSTLRKNLMEVSNTKYLIAATGEWMPPSLKQQVVGERNISHDLDKKLIEETSNDKEFSSIHSSEHLEVYELERDMSYCQEIEPMWIQDNYREKSLEFFQTSDSLPKFPVKGEPQNLKNGDIEVRCHKENPHTISVDSNGTGWILIKESYYPFWERSDGGNIIEGYGFQVIHINDGKNLELMYRPRKISTLSSDNILQFTGTIFS